MLLHKRIDDLSISRFLRLGKTAILEGILPNGAKRQVHTQDLMALDQR